MDMEFRGKVAMVTGAAGGIGRASALAFAQHGASVVLCDVADVSETASMVEAIGAKALPATVDVAESNSIVRAIEEALRAYGRLDYAHNNAGISAFGPLADIPEEDWRRVIDVNLTGAFLCMKYQIPHILSTGGAIVNTASIWSFQGTPEMCPYVASKHGLAGLTRAAAIDYGQKGIRINAIAPGPIRTPMTAPIPDEALAPIISRTTVNRMGAPEEVAEAVVWLCSSAASYINGVVLPVDGGYLAT